MTKQARPRCYYCDKPISFWPDKVGRERLWRGYGYVLSHEEQNPAPYFCKQKCAVNFATIMVRDGQRVNINGEMRIGGFRKYDLTEQPNDSKPSK